MDRSDRRYVTPQARLCALLAAASALAVACAPSGQPGDALLSGGDGADGENHDDGANDDDGADDDGDGLGSGAGSAGDPCVAGAVRACFDGPGDPGVGVCLAGVQRCSSTSEGEFDVAQWGACEGAVGPAEEQCGDGIDSDCDGVDPACGDGSGGGTGSAGGGDVDGSGGGGSSEPPEEIDLDLYLVGDCITATCPATHPFPVACNVVFSPGDDRGCIASAPSDSVVYFQAGDECNQGIVGGTLRCSTAVGAPLDGSNCPINKPVPIYVADPDGCPETDD